LVTGRRLGDEPLKYLIAISGPVASGKSVIAEQALARFSAHRISTRQLMIDAGVGDDRSRLIDEGKQLDRETDGAWVAQQSRKHVEQHEKCDVIIIDAVRTEQQVRHLRQLYGERIRHIHVDVPLAVAKRRSIS
jgi:adenylosuccinate synthase